MTANLKGQCWGLNPYIVLPKTLTGIGSDLFPQIDIAKNIASSSFHFHAFSYQCYSRNFLVECSYIGEVPRNTSSVVSDATLSLTRQLSQDSILAVRNILTALPLSYIGCFLDKIQAFDTFF